MSVAYGMEVRDNDDFITVAEEAMEGLSAAAVPGAFIVDLLPIRTCDNICSMHFIAYE